MVLAASGVTRAAAIAKGNAILFMGSILAGGSIDEIVFLYINY